VLGVAYKRNIKDIRESPALDVIKLLEDKGARVIYNDPHVPQFIWEGKPFKSTPLTAAVVKSCDLVIVVTDHHKFDYQWVVDHATAVFDTRNATHAVTRGRSKIELL